MKTLGIIGGLGPESTVDYYQRIIALYRERTGDGSYPEFIIKSVNLQKGLDFMDANDLTGMTDYLLEGIGKLARAGADFGLISANTPHIVFEDVASRAPIPLISIVEATCAAAKGRRLKRLALLETRAGLLTIVDRMKAKGDIDGVILAGTELPLILRNAEHKGIPFLDTTRIHVEAAVTEMLS